MAQAWFMEILEQHDPEFARLVAENREVVMKDGAIPARYKVLMTMLADAILGHADGVQSIARRARDGRQRTGNLRDRARCLRLRRHAGADHRARRVPAMIRSA